MGSGCAERVFLAQRAPYPHNEKTWRTIAYGDFGTRIRRIGNFRAVIACVAASVVRLTNPVPAMETTQWITYRKKSSQ